MSLLRQLYPLSTLPPSCHWHIGLSLVDLIDVIQRKRLPRTDDRRRGEMKSVLCIIVRAFFFIQAILDSIFLKGFQSVIWRILKATSPSDSAKSSVYTKSQIAYSIYDGRYKAGEPRPSVAPPIQLFHPAFGYFLDTISNTNIVPDDDVIQRKRLPRTDDRMTTRHTPMAPSNGFQKNDACYFFSRRIKTRSVTGVVTHQRKLGCQQLVIGLSPRYYKHLVHLLL